MFLVDLDSSLVENKIHIKQKLNFYNTDLHAYMNILPLDSLSYLGYNMWYTDEVNYNTNHIPMLSNQYFHIDY